MGGLRFFANLPVNKGLNNIVDAENQIPATHNAKQADDREGSSPPLNVIVLPKFNARLESRAWTPEQENQNAGQNIQSHRRQILFHRTPPFFAPIILWWGRFLKIAYIKAVEKWPYLSLFPLIKEISQPLLDAYLGSPQNL